MKSIVRVGRAGKRKPGMPDAAAIPQAPDARVELIQALIPLGLEAVNDTVGVKVVYDLSTTCFSRR